MDSHDPASGDAKKGMIPERNIRDARSFRGILPRSSRTNKSLIQRRRV